MKKKGEWQWFFEGHASIYMQNVFTANTVAEVDFLLQELNLPPQSAILDVGCGTGRHSIELARRGYRMTGVDLSEGMLARARKAADEAGVAPEWIHADATQFRSGRLYDAAICLCEGAFTLLNLDDDPIGHDLAIARNIHAALKPGAGFILTALSAFRYIRGRMLTIPGAAPSTRCAWLRDDGGGAPARARASGTINRAGRSRDTGVPVRRSLQAAT